MYIYIYVLIYIYIYTHTYYTCIKGRVSQHLQGLGSQQKSGKTHRSRSQARAKLDFEGSLSWGAQGFRAQRTKAWGHVNLKSISSNPNMVHIECHIF